MSGKKLVTRGDLMPTGDISIAEAPKKFSSEVIFLNIFAHLKKREKQCVLYTYLQRVSLQKRIEFSLVETQKKPNIKKTLANFGRKADKHILH